MGRIVSVQVGNIETLTRFGQQENGTIAEQSWKTAFRKQPIDGAVDVGVEGLQGDQQADRKHHGGPDKAVLLYANRHYPKWTEAYPQLLLEPGAFGENLTVDGLDESMVCVGDIYQIGNLLLEVSQPRVPCWKISQRWAEPSFTDAVRETGRTGWYARVKATGSVERGGTVTLLHRSNPAWTISRMNNVFAKRIPITQDMVRELRDCSAIADAWKDHITG